MNSFMSWVEGKKKLHKPLIKKKKLSKVEKILEWTAMPTFGIFEAVDQLNDGSSYYLAEAGGKQYFIIVSNDFIEYSELAKRVDGKKFEVGNNIFTKAGYELIQP